MRLIKLLSLLLLSTSVFFIYQKTSNNTYTILNIGDKLSIGINNYSYTNYYKNNLLKTKKEVIINNNYSKEDNTIDEILTLIQNTTEIKKDLREADQLIITLGYYDLIEKISIEEEITPYQLKIIISKIKNSYDKLITEIKKYYHNNIIVIGYYTNESDNYYKNEGIKKLNLILNKEELIFINTNELLKQKEKYFNNFKYNYPNRLGYQVIGKEIIRKTLEK